MNRPLRGIEVWMIYLKLCDEFDVEKSGCEGVRNPIPGAVKIPYPVVRNVVRPACKVQDFDTQPDCLGEFFLEVK